METHSIYQLFKYSRTGNVTKLRQLVEEEDIDVNIRDEWDSTPLYYACLCGHEKLVNYLLENGAKCQANSFDGERCLYSALTIEIKAILKNFKAITKDCMRRDNYIEFFKMCFNVQTYKDICFIVHGCQIFVHKIILACKSEYFANMFETRWKSKKYVYMKHPLVSATAFQLMIQYLYTDRIDVNVEDLPDLKRLAKQCQLVSLELKLLAAEKSISSYTKSKPSSMRDSVSLLSIQPAYDSLELNESYLLLTQQSLPYQLKLKHFPNVPPDIFFMDITESDDNSQLRIDYLVQDDIPIYSDICFHIDGYSFYGHKLFFCGRSEYFKTLTNFSELSTNDSVNKNGILHITLNDISADAFAVIYLFIYTNSVLIPQEYLYEVLHFSAMYILPTLKKKCSNQLKHSLTCSNVFEILHMSRLYALPYLESSCCEFMARNLEQIVNEEAFHQIILSDADEVKDRQQTDSISVIDDIRFHIEKAELPGILSGNDSNESVECGSSPDVKFQLIEQLLDDLGLEA